MVERSHERICFSLDDELCKVTDVRRDPSYERTWFDNESQAGVAGKRWRSRECVQTNAFKSKYLHAAHGDGRQSHSSCQLPHCDVNSSTCLPTGDLAVVRNGTHRSTTVWFRLIFVLILDECWALWSSESATTTQIVWCVCGWCAPPCEVVWCWNAVWRIPVSWTTSTRSAFSCVWRSIAGAVQVRWDVAKMEDFRERKEKERQIDR